MVRISVEPTERRRLKQREVPCVMQPCDHVSVHRAGAVNVFGGRGDLGQQRSDRTEHRLRLYSPDWAPVPRLCIPVVAVLGGGYFGVGWPASRAVREILDAVAGESIAALRSSGAGRILQPPQHGGLGLPADEFVWAVCELAAVSGSLGWLAAIYNAAAHEVAGLPPHAAHEVWDTNPDALITIGLEVLAIWRTDGLPGGGIPSSAPSRPTGCCCPQATRVVCWCPAVACASRLPTARPALYGGCRRGHHRRPGGRRRTRLHR